MDEIEIYIDGAAQKNPGPAGIGIIFKVTDDNICFKLSKFIGICTNNQAEYIALIESLKEAIKRNFKKVIIYSDSELVVNQLNEKYKVKNSILYRYYKEAKELMQEFDFIEIKTIKRWDNREADILASNACNESG